MSGPTASGASTPPPSWQRTPPPTSLPPPTSSVARARLIVEESALGKRTEIGRGANGVVYRVNGARLPDLTGDLVYKEYRQGVAVPSVQGLTGIIQTVDQLQDVPRRAMEQMTVWPLRVVVNNTGDTAGVLMRLIPDDFFENILLPSKKRAKIAREIQHLIVDPALARRSQVAVPDAKDLATRMRLCERLCYVFGIMHKANLVYGDISARNVLYTPRPEALILLVDCDAARREGHGAVNKQADSPDWDPPETQQSRRAGRSPSQTKETDRYKIALCILRCLTPGKGSSLNRDPAAADRVFPDRVGRDMMRRALNGGPGDRPSAAEWWKYLRGCLGDGPMPSSRKPSPPRPASVTVAPGSTHDGWRRGRHGQWERA